jgi:hypothetical protein
MFTSSSSFIQAMNLSPGFVQTETRGSQQTEQSERLSE